MLPAPSTRVGSATGHATSQTPTTARRNPDRSPEFSQRKPCSCPFSCASLIRLLYHPPVASAAQTITPAARLLVIGLDGATWTNLKPLAERGDMPTLQRLMR